MCAACGWQVRWQVRGVDEEGPETVVVATGNDVIVRSYQTPAISNISYWSHTLRYNEVQL